MVYCGPSGAAHRRRVGGRYGAQVITAAARGGGGGRGSPHRQQKTATGDEFGPTTVMNDDGLDVRRGWVFEREGGEMEARIEHGGGKPNLCDFYRAQVVRRCRGGEVVQWPQQ
jgi:hypothetical protein